jgi:colanic acid biosynthesis glycosyl transferase WcaI
VRFLLLNQFFVPDQAPTGQLLADVAREIAARGHSVTVVCARAAYEPGDQRGSVTQAHLRALWCRLQPAGPALDPAHVPAYHGGQPYVRVLHAPCLPFARRPAARLLSYVSFYAGAFWQSLRASRCDVVVTMTTPPLLSLLGTLLKKLRGARHYIWEMDMYPDVAVALGVLSLDSMLTRILGSIARYSRRNADGVIVLGPCMRHRVVAQGVADGKVHTVDNWADGAFIRSRPFPPAEPLVVLYSGNLGLAHDIDTIGAAMDQLRSDNRFRFVFAGGGARRRALEESCHAANVVWMPYQDRESLPAHLSSCHVGLVTQTRASLGALVPGKIYALMAAGRPLLYIGPREATAARIIERFGCGWQIEPGDSTGLVELLRLLAASPQLAMEAGARARRAFIENYDLPAGVSAVLGVLGLESPGDAPGSEKEGPLRRLIPVETPCTRRSCWESPPSSSH